MTVSNMAIAVSPQAIAATGSSWGECCEGDCSIAIQTGVIWLAGSRVVNVVRVGCSTPMLKF